MRNISAKEFDGYIISRGGEYLRAVIVSRYGEFQFIRWGKSPFDAWWTEVEDDAARVADKLGGQVVGFNQITGDLTTWTT